MLLLTSTSDLIQVVTSAAVTTDVQASYMDYNGTAVTPGRTNTLITTAATTTVVGSPGASVQRNVKFLSIRNKHASTSQGVIVRHTDGTNVAELFACTLLAGEQLVFVDGQGWALFDATGCLKITSPAPGRFLAVTVLTSGTSFTTGPQTTKLKLRMLGGGGAGGSSAGAASSGGFGSGGGEGTYAERLFTVSPNTAYTYAIGAGGTAGAAGNNAGNNGGNTTFAVGATTVTAPGGSGGGGSGAAAASVLTVAGGAGGTGATNADVNAPGQPGEGSFRFSAAVGLSGSGASSQLGGGGQGRATQGNGNAATGFGSGGSGGASVNSATNQAGGAGSGGVIIVEEYT